MPYVLEARVKQPLARNPARKRSRGCAPRHPKCFHGPRAKQVKNLSWLLAHAYEVEGFEAITWPEEDGTTCTKNPQVMMTAHLAGGEVFLSRWASLRVMKDWLHRPKFRGLPLTVDGTEDVC